MDFTKRWNIICKLIYLLLLKNIKSADHCGFHTFPIVIDKQVINPSKISVAVYLSFYGYAKNKAPKNEYLNYILHIGKLHILCNYISLH